MKGRPQRVDLRKMFRSLEAEMCEALTAKRQHLAHSGIKGTSTEARWARWFEKYLPMRYQVQHSAQIVDVDGKVSQQQDIVIYDRQYTPFLFNEDDAVYIPAEGVYAVFEAKQELNAKLIQYAGGKAATVRRLRRTSAPIHHAGGRFEAKSAQELPKILAGVLALDSGWAKGRWGASVKRAASRLAPDEQLDFACVLREGTAAVEYDAQGASLTTSTESLIFLFLSFLARIQQMGTVPAMDFAAYRHAIPTRLS